MISDDSNCGLQIDSSTAEISAMRMVFKFNFLKFIKSSINHDLSPCSILEAVGIKTKEVSSGFLPTKSNKAVLIDSLVIPPEVNNIFIVWN
jgi:hypothetical protein